MATEDQHGPLVDHHTGGILSGTMAPWRRELAAEPVPTGVATQTVVWYHNYGLHVICHVISIALLDMAA